MIACRIAVATGLLFLLSGLAAPADAQNQAPSAAPRPSPNAAPGPAFLTQPVPHTAARAQRAAEPADDFAGLEYTADEKAKIELVKKDGKLRRDTVMRDDKLSSEQREAMVQGLERIERGQIYRALTPEHQTEVRKRILAHREAAAKAQRAAQAQQNSATVSPPR